MMKKNKFSQVKIGAMISYGALAFSILTGLLYTPWMVNKIGQSNYGLYTLANSIISIFMLDFGLGAAVSRFVSKYRAENNQKSIDNIIGTIYKLYIIIDAVIIVVLTIMYFLLEDIYVKLTPAEIEQFKIIYIIVAAFNVVAFPLSPLNGILNAYEKFVQLKICDLISKILNVALVILALTYSSSVVLVVASMVISNLIGMVAKFIIVKVTLPVHANFKLREKSIYASLFSFTIWTTIISVMQRFTHSVSPSILGVASGSVEIAVYAPAVTLEGYFYMVATAVNGLFLPRISRYIADNREENILTLMIKVGKYQLLLLGWIVVGFVCVGQEFMNLWMGPEYSRTYYLAIIILIPTMIASTQQIATTTLIAKKLVKYQAICMVCTGTIGLGIGFALSFLIGAFGVCIGTSIAAILNIVIFNIIYQKKAGIDIITFYKKSYLRACPCFVISVVLGLLLASKLPIGGWFGLIIKASIVSVIYAVAFWIGYFSKTEKKALLKHIFH